MKLPVLVIRLWETMRAKRAYDEPPPRELASFTPGREIPIDGVRLRVVKAIGGPLPIILLTPIGLTKRRMLTTGQKLRTVRRHQLAYERQVATAIATELRRGGSR